ncbi:hypothetical protein GCM10009696_10060 [Kocuria himachalensis]
MHAPGVPAGPVGGQEPDSGDVPDVPGVHPGHPVVDRQGGAQHSGPHRLEVQQQVREEVTAAQVGDVRTRGVEQLLRAGQAVDLPETVAGLGPDAALEDHPWHGVLGHRRSGDLPRPGVADDGVVVVRRWVHPVQGVGPGGRPGHGGEVALVPLDHLAAGPQVRGRPGRAEVRPRRRVVRAAGSP